MEPPLTRPKRKLDTEDPGEASRFAPSSRPANLMTKKGSISGSASQIQLSSKTSTGRAAIGNNSFGTTMGPGRRGFSNRIERPQTSMFDSRMRRTASSANRPSSSLEVYSQPSKGSQGIGNQGRILFSSNPLQVNKPPTKPESIGCYDPHIYCNADRESPCAKGRPRGRSSMTSALKALTMNAPLTPSQIPLRASTHSARVTTPSTSRSPKKALSLGRFLTRDSNTPAAWNTEDRFERMEHGFSELKEIIGGATSEGSNLKDIIAIYKTKGRWTWRYLVMKFCSYINSQ